MNKIFFPIDLNYTFVTYTSSPLIGAYYNNTYN